MKQLLAIIGKEIRLKDKRTGSTYTAMVWDAKLEYGNLRICVDRMVTRGLSPRMAN